MMLPLSISIHRDVDGSERIVFNPAMTPPAELIDLLSRAIGRVQAATTPATPPPQAGDTPAPAEDSTPATVASSEEGTPDAATPDRPADPGDAVSADAVVSGAASAPGENVDQGGTSSGSPDSTDNEGA